MDSSELSGRATTSGFNASISNLLHLVAIWNKEQDRAFIYINSTLVLNQTVNVRSYTALDYAYMLFGMQKCASTIFLLPGVGCNSGTLCSCIRNEMGGALVSLG